jgi:putative ABC transport system permease protein
MMIAPFLQDLRFAGRLLLRSPGFTLIAVAAIALGIGANTAIFSVVNGVLLKSLPYRDPDGIVMVWERNIPRDRKTNSAGPANFLAWRDENHVFEQMAAISPTFAVNLTGAGDPAEVRRQLVNAEFFSILGINPELGRPFTRQEDDADADVVVISHRLWQERLDGQDVVGRQITLNGTPQTVVGVMPAGFYFRDRTVDVWSPVGFTAASREPHGRSLAPIARLKPGVSVEQAQAEMNTIAARLAARWPEFDTGWTTNVRPIQDEITGDVRPALVILLGAVGFVLLIACANVANLLLARATARQRELAVRAALGASRGRLTRQLLAESLLLAVAGGVAGFALAWAGVHLLRASIGDQIAFPRIDAIGLDGRVLAFTAIVAVLSGIIFGLAPALTSASIDLNGALKDGGRSGSGGRTAKLRSAFVVVEVALALVLLVGAGLLLRSFARVLSTDPGFSPDGVMTMQLTLPAVKYPGLQPRTQFWHALLDRIRTLPGVTSTGTVSFLPMNGLGSATSFEVVGQPKPPPGQGPVATIKVVDGDYFTVLGIPLLRGRLFTPREQQIENHYAVVSETLARQLFPNQDPIGQRLQVSWNGEGADEIIGVVGDTKMVSIEEQISPAIYFPYSRTPYASETVVVRTAGNPSAVASSLVQAVHQIDADLPVSNMRSMNEVIARSLAERRIVMVLLAVFAAVALVLATVGIYGVMSYMVSQRTQEIGIRMALGADRPGVVAMVLAQALRLAAGGLVAGCVAALALTGLLRAMLYDVRPTDPLTFGVVATILFTIAAIATAVPAIRATRIDPLQALKAE